MGKSAPTLRSPAIAGRIAYLGHPSQLSAPRGHRALVSLNSILLSGLDICPENFPFPSVALSRYSTCMHLMALVVEQTLPYSASALHLEDPKRWSRLFPLIRPSVKAVDLPTGQTVVVDTALVKSKDVLIAVIGRLGHLSNRILSDSLAAFSIAQDEELAAKAEEIEKLLHQSGFNSQGGIVVVRTGSKQGLMQVSDNAVEVTVPGELKLDHILSLLLSSNKETK